MAGTAKPTGVGNEGSIKIISAKATYKGTANVFNDVLALFDSEINSSAKYGDVLLASFIIWGYYIEFTVPTKSRIWAYSDKDYFDSGGSTPGIITLQKKVNGIWITQSKHDTQTETWYILLDDLSANTNYRIIVEDDCDYVNFSEWYIESLYTSKFLLESGNKIYTIANSELNELGSTDGDKTAMFTQGFESLTKENCELIAQELGKAKIIKMDV